MVQHFYAHTAHKLVRLSIYIDAENCLIIRQSENAHNRQKVFAGIDSLSVWYKGRKEMIRVFKNIYLKWK